MLLTLQCNIITYSCNLNERQSKQFQLFTRHGSLQQFAYIPMARNHVIGLYRENAIAIESEAKDPFGGNVYYVTMQITLPIPEFTRNERNFHCDVLHITVEPLLYDHP